MGCRDDRSIASRSAPAPKPAQSSTPALRPLPKASARQQARPAPSSAPIIPPNGSPDVALTRQGAIRFNAVACFLPNGAASAGLIGDKRARARWPNGLFDHLVGQHLHRIWNCEAKQFRSAEIDDQFVLFRQLNRQVPGLLAPDDSGHVPRGSAICF